MHVTVDKLMQRLHSDGTADDTFVYLFPARRNDLVTFRSDANCSCAKRIKADFEARLDLASTLAKAYWPGATVILNVEKIQPAKEKPRSQVIPADPAAFDQLLDNLDRDTFRGVLVVPNNDMVSWTVLFY